MARFAGSTRWVRWYSTIVLIAVSTGTATAAPAQALSDSIIQAQQVAAPLLASPQDIDVAVASMQTAIPAVAPGDVPSLTLPARRALAWYAGLLVQNVRHAQEAMQLLDALRAATPRDPQILQLHAAASTWAGVMSPPRGAPTLPSIPSTLTAGAVPGPVAQTERYVVSGRWCNAVDEPSRNPADFARGYTDPSEALDACFRGLMGLAVHDPGDLHFVRFIPVSGSDALDQQAISAIAILGDTAFAAIGHRYPEKSSDRLVAVDLRSGKVTARSRQALRPSVQSGKLFGCEESEPTCAELDPATLRKRPGGASLDSPDDDVPRIRLLDSRDGMKVIAPPIPDSPYRFEVRGSGLPDGRDPLLVARDVRTGEFVCAWPGVATKFGWPTPMFHPRINVLVLIATATSAADVTPSVILDVPLLISRAKECALGTARARDALDRAIRPLARVK